MASSINLFQKDHKTTKGYVLSLNENNVPLYENVEDTHWNNILKD